MIVRIFGIIPVPHQTLIELVHKHLIDRFGKGLAIRRPEIWDRLGWQGEDAPLYFEIEDKRRVRAGKLEIALVVADACAHISKEPGPHQWWYHGFSINHLLD